jgi:hypothetical protein
MFEAAFLFGLGIIQPFALDQIFQPDPENLGIQQVEDCIHPCPLAQDTLAAISRSPFLACQ